MPGSLQTHHLLDPVHEHIERNITHDNQVVYSINRSAIANTVEPPIVDPPRI